jgi:hypothetical protein
VIADAPRTRTAASSGYARIAATHFTASVSSSGIAAGLFLKRDRGDPPTDEEAGVEGADIQDRTQHQNNL